MLNAGLCAHRWVACSLRQVATLKAKQTELQKAQLRQRQNLTAEQTQAQGVSAQEAELQRQVRCNQHATIT